MAQFVNAGSLVHHVRSDGPADAPVIVFVNALGTDLRIWDDVVDRLGSSARAIRYDMRGHGLTSCAPPPYSIDDLADDLEHVLEAIGIADFTLCGISVGGMVALQVCARQPGRVRGLLLCSTGVRIGTPEMWNARIDAVARGGTDAIADAAMARWFSRGFRTAHSTTVAGYRRLLERCPAEGYLGVCAAIRDADLERAARQIRRPTVVACGEEDEATTPALGESLARTIPGARLEIVRDVAHLPCVEAPSVVAALAASFVQGDHHG
jgi:3-oxoadipate enol-lactonase